MRQLFINGVQLDLAPDEAIACTYQRNDIAELKNRQADYSNEFKVPLTNQNKIALGNPDLVQTDSIKPYKFNNAKILQGGIEIVQNGVASIQSSSLKGFVKVVVYSGIYDFFKILGDKTLKDIVGLANSNHIWSSSVAGVATVMRDKDYIYPLVQYGGEDNVGSNFNIAQQVPSMLVHRIVDYIFEEAGYKKNGLLFDNDFYRRLILPCTDLLVRSEKFIQDRSCFVAIGIRTITEFVGEPIGFETAVTLPSSPEYGGGLALGQYGSFSAKKFPFSIDFTSKGDEFFRPNGYFDGISNNFDSGSYQYVADVTMVANIYVNFRFEIATPVFGDCDFKFSIRKNSGIIVQSDVNYTSNGTKIQKEKAINIVISQGDIIEVFYELIKNNGIGQPDAFFYIGGTNLTITPTKIIPVNSTLVIADIIPDLKQVDFLKAIFQIFAVSCQSENSTRTMSCVMFKDIARARPKNWSDKLDLTKDISINYRIGEYGRKNLLKYKEEKDNARGDGAFTIDDDVLDLDATLVSLPFAASKDDAYVTSLDIVVANIPLIVEGQRKKVEPRILALRKDEPAIASLILFDGVTSNASFTNVAYPSAYFIATDQDGSLGFNYLIPTFYSELVRALNKCKVVSCYMNLTAIDIQNLDFFTPIYIEYFNAIFCINKIEDYTGEGSTLCELIRL